MTLPLGFNLLDVALLLVMLLFMIRGFFRGFANEMAGLVSLVGGIWLAGTFYTHFGQMLLPYIKDPIWANMVAFALIVVVTVLTVSALSGVLRKFLALPFADWLNQLIGGVAGLLKGFVVCAIAICLMQHFLADAPFMTTSKVRPHIAKYSMPLIDLLPLNISYQAAITTQRFAYSLASPYEIRILS